jgi:hypothetical protein
MLSQIGYLGCIITPNEQQFNRLQKLLDDYCLGPLRVAKKRLYLQPNEGGLGLINLREFRYNAPGSKGLHSIGAIIGDMT